MHLLSVPFIRSLWVFQQIFCRQALQRPTDGGAPHPPDGLRSAISLVPKALLSRHRAAQSHPLGQACWRPALGRNTWVLQGKNEACLACATAVPITTTRVRPGTTRVREHRAPGPSGVWHLGRQGQTPTKMQVALVFAQQGQDAVVHLVGLRQHGDARLLQDLRAAEVGRLHRVVGIDDAATCG